MILYVLLENLDRKQSPNTASGVGKRRKYGEEESVILTGDFDNPVRTRSPLPLQPQPQLQPQLQLQTQLQLQLQMHVQMQMQIQRQLRTQLQI